MHCAVSEVGGGRWDSKMAILNQNLPPCTQTSVKNFEPLLTFPPIFDRLKIPPVIHQFPYAAANAAAKTHIETIAFTTPLSG